MKYLIYVGNSSKLIKGKSYSLHYVDDPLTRKLIYYLFIETSGEVYIIDSTSDININDFKSLDEMRDIKLNIVLDGN